LKIDSHFQKSMAGSVNYTNHIADTLLDQAFGSAAWSKAA